MLVGAVVLITACVATPEPQLEVSPSVEVAVVGASPTQAPTEPDPNIDTKPDIYLVDPKSGAVTLLLSAPGSQTNAEVSPHGRRVVYESRAHGDPSQIFVLKADGAKRRLTHLNGGASDPTWSPDGTKIAFSGIRRRDGDLWPDADIFVMNADGTHIRRFAGTPKDDGHPDWSPDGSRIVFHGRRSNGRNVWARLPLGQIWVASVHDRTRTRLEHGGGSYGEIDPAWSPDGRWIAYSSVDAMINGKLLSSALWLMRPNGTHKRRVVKSVGTFNVIENPSWSPDGRSIVFEENGPTSIGIHWDGAVGAVGVINVRTERRRWVVGRSASDQPSWGPEGILVGLSPDDAAAMPGAPVQDGWDPTWEPSRSEQPDATIVMTESGCRRVGPAHVVDPGVLAFKFVNDSHLESVFTVVRSARGQPRDLWDKRARIGGDWSDFLNPSRQSIWSSPGKISSGWWAVMCGKDTIAAGNGISLKKAGIVGPLKVG